MKRGVCLLTGGTSGIGKATAFKLSESQWKLVIVGRDSERGSETVEELTRKTGNDNVYFIKRDLSIQSEVRKLSNEFKDLSRRLDVLINNAGVALSERRLTVDGVETTFAVNYLAPFLLTNLLLDTLKSSAPSRIVNVASSVHAKNIDFDNLQGEKYYSFLSAYSRSKLAIIIFTVELARRLVGSNVTVNCLHPGMIRSNLNRDLNRFYRWGFRLISPFLKSPSKGADNIVYLATSPELEGVTGKYFVGKKEGEIPEAALNLETAKKLWEVSAHLTGLDVEF